jgi:outer membrane protein assembly factor BamE (lipoprotein component of BamABCDE complex)
MRTNLGLVSVLLVVLTLTACGAHPSAKIVRGVIVVRSGMTASALRHSVAGVAVGASAFDVRKKLGKPFTRVSSQGQSCWVYHARQPGTALDALDFCMDKSGEVARILTGVHT